MCMVFISITMLQVLGDKRFDIDKDDSIIIDKVRDIGTLGLYELIFQILLDETVFTEDDKQTYKSIMLTTNAHRRSHSAHNGQQGIQIQVYHQFAHIYL